VISERDANCPAFERRAFEARLAQQSARTPAIA
jgi:hypothetical protein